MEAKRLEIWIADLGESFGCEQRGQRPVIVIQNDVGNKFSSTVIVASITSEKKSNLPTHVELMAGLTRKDSTILFEQIHTVDKRKLLRKVGNLPRALESKVEKALMISIGLTPVPSRRVAK